MSSDKTVCSENQDPVRIFIGSDPSQALAARVLEHSIRKYTHRPLEFRLMQELAAPKPAAREKRQRTGFSFYRFMIPEMTGYRGKAIYLDADMQVFGDIGELWDLPFNGRKLLCSVSKTTPEAWKSKPGFRAGRQLSVLLLDCSRLEWKVEEICEALDRERFTYSSLMQDCCLLGPEEIGETIPPEWNSLELYEAGKTRLVHYTVGRTQPWINDHSQLKYLWHDALRQAVEEGFVSREEIERDIGLGFVKPSLLGEICGTRKSSEWRLHGAYWRSKLKRKIRKALQ